MNSARRLLFVYPEGNITNNPHFSALITLLGQAGFVCDILIPDREDTAPGEIFPGCFVIKTSVPPRPLAEDALLTRGLTDQAEINQQLQNFLNSHARYDHIIGIDRGIIEAAALAELAKIPVGLLSYEICFADECVAGFKDPEIAACKNLSFVICQDKLRGSFVCKENQIDPNKLILMPVAGTGIKRGPRLTLMHDALGLPHSTKILLYMGELRGEWAGVKRLLAGSKSLPSNWVIVLHHRFSNEVASGLLAEMDLLPGRKVFFSPFKSLPFSEMYQLLHSVDLGVAIYYGTYDHPAVGKNIHHIGLASGKFSTYLQHGVPVLANTNGEMSDLIKSSGAGVVVDDFSTLGDTLSSFELIPFDARREQAWKLFEQHLDVGPKMEPLIQILRS